MTSEKQTIKLSTKPHRFNDNEDWKSIKKEVSSRLGYHINRDEVKAIWNTYISSYLQDKLINDGEFVFLSKVGKLGIYKQHILENEKLLRLIKSGRKVQSHNRANYHYAIAFVKGDGVAKEIKFKPAQVLKDKLSHILNTTNKDYKPKSIINN